MGKKTGKEKGDEERMRGKEEKRCNGKGWGNNK